MDVYKKINYTESILLGSALKKYRQILAECKDSEKGIAGDHWTLESEKGVSMEQLWSWSKVGAINRAGYLFTGPERCVYFEKVLCFKLGKSMWRKHR